LATNASFPLHLPLGKRRRGNLKMPDSYSPHYQSGSAVSFFNLSANQVVGSAPRPCCSNPISPFSTRIAAIAFGMLHK
jgi:hypothetical protein